MITDQYKSPYVMLLSDAIISGVHGTVLEGLEGNGVKFSKPCLFSNSIERMKCVYEQLTFADPQVEKITWELMGRLYQSAPSFICRATMPNVSDEYSAIIKIKGAPKPKAADPSSIRYIADAENVMLNYMHSPDNTVELRRELDCLISDNRQRGQLLDDDVGDDFICARDLSTLFIPEYGTRRTLSFPHVILKAMFRSTLSDSERSPHLVSEVRGTISDCYDKISTIQRAPDRHEAINEYAANMLEAYRSAPGASALIALLNIAAGETNLTATESVAELVYLDPIELSVIQSHMMAAH